MRRIAGLTSLLEAIRKRVRSKSLRVSKATFEDLGEQYREAQYRQDARLFDAVSEMADRECPDGWVPEEAEEEVSHPKAAAGV